MTYVDIICEKTVDERIVKALRKKINIASWEIMGEELKDWMVNLFENIKLNKPY